MRGRLLTSLLLACSSSSFAATSYTLTAANCGSCVTENLLFSGATPDALLISGFTNQSSYPVDVLGVQTLHGNGGQARVEGVASATYGQATFTMPGRTFGTIIMNVNASEAATVRFVIDGVQDPGSFAVGSGSNFFSIIADLGSTLSSVMVKSYVSSNPSTSIQDIRQIRLGGVADAATPTPEPGSLALMGIGVILLSFKLRQRR